MLVVEEFAFDDRNIEKMAAHDVSQRQLREALTRRYVIRRNRQNRRAPLLFIGSDDDGLCVAAPIEPTTVLGVYRPVTAWYCKASEWAKLPRGR